MRDWIVRLKYPQHRFLLALLSITALQTWYAAQDARAMVFLGQSDDFVRFWYYAYVLPVRFRRFLLKIKRFGYLGSLGSREMA